MTKTIAFCGGGTAGHIMPNFALIDRLNGEYNCVYIGGDGMEKSLCLTRGIPFYAIDTVKFDRSKFFKNFAVPFKLAHCVKSAKKALAEIKPDLIISKGGYAALPVVLAAKKIPVVSHESDFSPGLATKLSKNRSKYVLCAFEPCAKRFKNGVAVGTPLAAKLYGGNRNKQAYGLTGAKPTLAVVGGSSGAMALNSCVVEALPLLTEKFDVIHVTGKNKRGADRQKDYSPVEFEYDMPRLYATADIVLSRAGANALAECIALKKPTLAVPLEKASRGDQLQNADYFASRGAIKVLREKDMTPQTLALALDELYNNKYKYYSAMSALSVDGTDRICGIVKDILSVDR